MFKQTLTLAVKRLDEEISKHRSEIWARGINPTLVEAVIKNCRTKIVFNKESAEDVNLEADTLGAVIPQYSHGEKYFVHHDPVTQPRLEETNASVSLWRQEGNDTILLGLKYFSNPQEAKAFVRVIGSFLEDALYELELELVCRTPDENLVWPTRLKGELLIIDDD